LRRFRPIRLLQSGDKGFKISQRKPHVTDYATSDIAQASAVCSHRVGVGRHVANPTEILRMVNSSKTIAAEAARLFWLHRSSISRLMSQARAEKTAAVGDHSSRFENNHRQAKEYLRFRKELNRT
jgi:hypothetical protein